MRARLNPAMLLPVAIAALLAAPASASTAAQPAPVPAAAAQKLFVQLEIQSGGKTLKHPGHKMETGEELVLILNEGKKKHEAVVYVESTDAGYTVEVTYSAGGKQRLKGTKSTKGDAWVAFESDDGKSKVKVKLKTDGKRKDDINVGGGDDPLDGLD